MKKVDHSEWAAPIVVVPKGDGCLRVCEDYKMTINSVLVVDKYLLPKPEDLMAQFAGKQKFSKLDLSHAYITRFCYVMTPGNLLQLITHLRVFKYIRVPFGIASALALFRNNGHPVTGYSK